MAGEGFFAREKPVIRGLCGERLGNLKGSTSLELGSIAAGKGEGTLIGAHFLLSYKGNGSAVKARPVLPALSCRHVLCAKRILGVGSIARRGEGSSSGVVGGDGTHACARRAELPALGIGPVGTVGSSSPGSSDLGTKVSCGRDSSKPIRGARRKFVR